MIRVKDIQKYFKVWRYDNGKRLILNHPTEYGKLSPSKYVGHVDKHKDGWYFAPNCKPTSNIVQLLMDIEDYQKKTFKYDSEFYNPCYRKGYFVDAVVNDWLRDHGFKWGNAYSGFVTYHLERDNVYGLHRDSISLSFDGLDTSYQDHSTPEKPHPTEVTISLHTGDFQWKWVERKVERTCEAIIEGIEDLLKPLLLVDASSDLKASEKMTVHDMNIHVKKLQGFSVAEKSIKEDLIKQLEETLETLKNS